MGNKVLIIVGPTAVGKTQLSIELAQYFNGEIISGDSMQVYRNLDIGTAKITHKEMQNIKHYLIDCCEIDERWSVAEFIKASSQYIDEITKKNKLPFIVGGTGFYVQALLDNFQLGKDKYDENLKVRNEWIEYSKKNGKRALWDELNKVDSKAAKKIPISNERRVVRALEVYNETGEKFSNQKDVRNKDFDPLIIGLTTKREKLYERINQRVDLMLIEGLETEARRVYETGNVELPAAKGIGYKEFYPYFRGEYSYQRAVELIKQNSRHYAKRQLTWFRNKMDVIWFDLIEKPEETEKIKKVITEWIQK
ncbi:tRNA (adenosine(37)-N6)-dimethylallyltransferase MiaA [Ligilactobacillus sp. WILCCON 0076]|uniref:tRNA dimethylallyltransferase n=1 Tax=Ligilactobacillus ubinensis TaxID=2876789 RepID=A0A9X2FJF0_9LACO|nr:tRNA (adenosine(37)-N6)-dimethylallyltransferase MiaA [Ligilactobacillus ubinensis]MCP0886787.1 tRNA (adenosine(37)-N6)-dimethylallyltransferase MiaA [Ligilactobacillus ubinensis]